MVVTKALCIILISATTAYSGFVPGNYVFHNNPIFQHASPSFQVPVFNYPQSTLTHYPAPTFGQFQNRPPFAVAAARPQFVAIHAEQPKPVVGVTAQQNPIPVNSFSNVVAVHAARPVEVRKLVLPYPPQVQNQVPHYSYGYAVKDVNTGDEKSHQETRTGDNVVGKYTIVEPDGTLRVVNYTAGKGGFNAVVERTPGYTVPNAPNSIKVNSKPVFVTSPGSFASAVAVPVATTYPYPAGFHFGG